LIRDAPTPLSSLLTIPEAIAAAEASLWRRRRYKRPPAAASAASAAIAAIAAIAAPPSPRAA
jgi:hypothetical protein